MSIVPSFYKTVPCPFCGKPFEVMKNYGEGLHKVSCSYCDRSFILKVTSVFGIYNQYDTNIL